jgi:hypothetical protein
VAAAAQKASASGGSKLLMWWESERLTDTGVEGKLNCCLAALPLQQWGTLWWSCSSVGTEYKQISSIIHQLELE